MKLTLDVENTVTHRDGKMHLDPFEPTNSLRGLGNFNDRIDILKRAVLYLSKNKETTNEINS